MIAPSQHLTCDNSASYTQINATTKSKGRPSNSVTNNLDGANSNAKNINNNDTRFNANNSNDTFTNTHGDTEKP